MPIPKKFATKADEVLGREATEAMSDWIDDTESRLDTLLHQCRADIAELRHETRADIAELRHQMETGLLQVREEIRVGFANVDARLGRQGFEIMKRAFGFWIASLAMLVGAIAAFFKLSR